MKIGVVGCAGRMGRMLCAAALATKGADLVGGTEAQGSKWIGVDLGFLCEGLPKNTLIGDDPVLLFDQSDVVIDFTAPHATVTHAKIAAETRTAMVIGTTGLNERDIKILEIAGQSTPIVHAGNMSLGINLLVGLVKQVTASLGNEYDIEIVEMHHRHKVDAPSGTALMLGHAAAEGRAVNHKRHSIMAREGQTGKRPKGGIGYATLRGGDVIGDHSVICAGPGERVELSHKATSRDVFAQGALRAALWLEGQPPSLYTMCDVLGL
ncbi:MAG: 4-hydroxy-tetrahydrodipicolinate reductase [Rhodospirillaceae bacterium TMED8]|nr:4-hydroxy-tetrahydrodipicolinate reductase [Magnetovibrio sp.]OUT50415.1 MAG: 4-hydroxy-tetrahydrodipicolinate reductase [Rhodospirillaceae bacterium TMED8]|tara:strand:+ start:6909 stop:7706 length:798 start_codon:yes stop_codon:yes gene_type:complete